MSDDPSPPPAHPLDGLCRHPPARPARRGLDALWHAFGLLLAPRGPARFLRGADAVLRLEPVLRVMTDATLAARRDELRERFRRARAAADDLTQAAALIRELARRTLGLSLHRVQVAGGLALAAGRGVIVEMATGEGKTVTAGIPAVLAGWRGKGCHVITVNDYLADRDARGMAPLFAACGLSVDRVVSSSDLHDRQRAYACDVTYATNKEVAADYLRDRLALGAGPSTAALLARGRADAAWSRGLVFARPLDTAIVDEADSVLIDEAVTPLIIATESEDGEPAGAYRLAERIARGLQAERDYRADAAQKEVRLTGRGRVRAADLLEAEDAGDLRWGRRAEELVVQALAATQFYVRDRQYVVQEGRAVIVDESTGRVMPDRTWRDGLHQAVEAKEGLPHRPAQTTLARVSFQRFFRMYPRLSGMTGTATEVGRELWHVYDLPVARIPPNRPCVRVRERPRIHATADRRWRDVLVRVEAAAAAGRPVLCGCRTVHASEHLSALLSARGIAHSVLNAVRSDAEAEIIAAAGRRGAVTIATNMAGRGTDIKLGPGVAELGGLLVVATELHESRRIDRQLAGRAGRQGDPGRSVVIASFDDDLLARFGGLVGRLARAAVRLIPALAPALSPVFALAQHRAQRWARSQRRAVQLADDWVGESLAFVGPPE